MLHGGDIYNNEILFDYSVNLNPYKIPDCIGEAIQKSISKINAYPDINQNKVREAVAKIDDIDESMVIAGNGASELLMAITRAINPTKALIVEPSFYGYRHSLEALKECEINSYILKEENDFKLTDDFLEYINESVDVIYLADPMNPTGKGIDNELLYKILKKAAVCKTFVVLDESFYFMSDKVLTDEYFNEHIRKLLDYNQETYIIRSFTKLFAVPGVRAGYAISSANNIKEVIKQLPEWNVSSIAEAVLIEGARLISNQNYIIQSCQYIKQEREYLIGELQKLGIKVFESDTSFILVKTDKPLYEMLLDKGLLIRDCSNFEGLQKGFYRIAVKNRDLNEILITTIKNIIVKE